MGRQINLIIYFLKFASKIVVNFLDLRKQARQLENEIDAKLVSFSKLGLGSTPFNNSSKSNG